MEPCPFCGSTRGEVERESFAPEPSAWSYLCLSCRAQGPLADDGEAARARWNERGGGPLARDREEAERGPLLVTFEGGRWDGLTLEERSVRSSCEGEGDRPLSFDEPGRRYVVYHNEPRPFEPAPEVYEVTSRRDPDGNPVHRYVGRA